MSEILDNVAPELEGEDVTPLSPSDQFAERDVFGNAPTKQIMDLSELENVLGPDAYHLTPATLANKLSEGGWIPAKHLLYLSKIIAYELAKGNARLIISLPPRHGKSELISHWTSVWALDQYPWWEIILASYGSDLATDFGRKVRDTISYDRDPVEGARLLNVDLNKTSLNVGRWHTTEGGGMRSVGIGGTVYGRGAHLLLIDDYLKNPEEAMSETQRDKVFDWFSTVAMSRLAPGGSAIIIATRWHKDDLSGRMLRLPGSKWKEICIPVRIDTEEQKANDPLGREIGEVLWPERYGPEAIKELEQTMTSYFFSAIMQQAPKASQSQHFKPEWIQVVDKLPHSNHLQFLRSWDLAGTEGDGDWTVGTLIARDVRNNDIYICARERKQLAPGGVERLVEGTADDDGAHTSIIIEQEPGSSGKAVVDGYITKLPMYSVRGIRHTGDKVTRAEPFFAACEHGRVKMLRNHVWNQEMLDELIEFPDGKHDDQTDTLSQGYNYLFSKKPRAGVFGRGTGVGKTSNQGVAVASSGGATVTGCVFGRK